MTDIISILSDLVPGKKIDGSTDDKGIMWFELAPLASSLGMRAGNVSDRLISDHNTKTQMGVAKHGSPVPRTYVNLGGIIEILLNSQSSSLALARARVMEHVIAISTGQITTHSSTKPSLPVVPEPAPGQGLGGPGVLPLASHRAERVADNRCWVGALLLDSSTAGRVQKATVEVQLAAEHEANVTREATRLMRALRAHYGQTSFSGANIDEINNDHNAFRINEPDPRAEVAEAYKRLKAYMVAAGVKPSACRAPYLTARILDALAVEEAFDVSGQSERGGLRLVILERRHSKRVVCIREVEASALPSLPA